MRRACRSTRSAATAIASTRTSSRSTTRPSRRAEGGWPSVEVLHGRPIGLVDLPLERKYIAPLAERLRAESLEALVAPRELAGEIGEHPGVLAAVGVPSQASQDRVDLMLHDVARAAPSGQRQARVGIEARQPKEPVPRAEQPEPRARQRVIQPHVRDRPRQPRAQRLAQPIEESIRTRTQVLIRYDPDAVTPEQIHVAPDETIVFQVAEREPTAWDGAVLDERTQRPRPAIVHVLRVDRAKHLVLSSNRDQDS